MNKVFTFCAVTDGNRFEFVSGYFDGYHIPKTNALQAMALRRTPWFGRDVLLTIARHLWSMRSKGVMCIVHRTSRSEPLDYNQQTQYVKEYHAALVPIVEPLGYEMVFFVISDVRTHIKSTLIDVMGEESVNCIRVSLSPHVVRVDERLEKYADHEYSIREAAIASAMLSDL